MRLVDSVRDRLGALPSRWPWLRLVVDVKDRFDEVHGGYLASSVTMAGFLSLFPLLLVVTAVVGFVSAGGSDIAADVVNELGLTGEASRAVVDAIGVAEENRRTASLIGLVGMLWSGLGVVAALQYGYDAVWQVKGRGIKDKLYGLAWLVGAGLLFAASFAVTSAVRLLPAWVAPVNLMIGVAVSVVLFTWSFRVLGNRDVGVRALLPGALLGAVGFEVLKALGSIYVPQVVARSSALYGSIGTVFAILTWLFLFGRLVILSAVLNVVLWERGHGTATVEVEVPNLPGEIPETASRSGEVVAG